MNQSPIKNIVLVHGAFVDGSSWSEVITRLHAKDYAVSAVQNPLTSLSDDVLATKRVLERQDGPVVLVGHSWAGAVITEAGAAANVAALVYVSALAPDMGESVFDLQQRVPTDEMNAAKPDRSGLLWVTPEHYADLLAGDLAPARVRTLAAIQQPIAASCFEETLSTAAWREKPSHYLVSANDKALSPDLQRWMASRMNAFTANVPSSHMSVIAQPDGVVALIERAASVRCQRVSDLN